MKMLSITDVLSPAQVAETGRILDRHAGNLLGTECIGELKAYYAGFRVELKAKGVVAEYLAYAVVYVASVKYQETH